MLSRVADAIYWMSRYFERAENTARIVDVNHNLFLDGEGPTSLPATGETPAPPLASLRRADRREARYEEHYEEQWVALVSTLGDEQLFAARYGSPTRDAVLRFLTFDREAPGSVLSCLSVARENARTVREVISSEMWEQVNETYLRAVEASKDPVSIASPHEFLGEVKKAAQLFVGITYLTMTHNEPWHFARVGRLLERADMTSRILDVKHAMIPKDPSTIGSPRDELAWGALLRSASALEMYRKRHGQIMPSQIVAFLLFDEKFPRSVRYCLRKADRSLHAITGRPLGDNGSSAEQRLAALVTRVERTDVGEVLARGLHTWVDELQHDTNAVGAKVHESFLAAQKDAG